ncbi:gastrula zinc finger protein XlCGF7.1 isoform X4 [Anabrus simplex]
MEEPVFIKCEPGYVSDTAKLHNADHGVKLLTEEQTDVKTEPEDVFYKPFIKEELEIQDMKIETSDEEYNASVVPLKKNPLMLMPSGLQPANFNHYKSGLECNVCRRFFRAKRTLEEHLLIHSGQKPHSCVKCGKSFRYVASWRTHQLIHSGEKNHACSVCGSRFIARSTLKSHLLTHSKEKLFKCSYCGKAFAREKYVDSHMIVHTMKPGRRPNACNTCGKVFYQSKARKTHFCIYK